jgi:hypothetical protein
MTHGRRWKSSGFTRANVTSSLTFRAITDPPVAAAPQSPTATRPVVAKRRMCEGVIDGSVAGLYRQALHRYGPADGELLAIALLEEQAGLRLRHPPAACGPDDPRPLTRVFSFCPAQRGRCGKLPGAWRPAGAR